MHQPTPLTQEALKLHNEQIQKEVRQFSCPRCRSCWWRVVPARKPVSTCSNCKQKLYALPQCCEFGIGRYTCPNAECGQQFYSKCFVHTKKSCPKCSTVAQSPYIHPKNKHKYKEKGRDEFDNLPMEHYCVCHISTGSTEGTWLSQTAALTGQSSCCLPLGHRHSPSHMGSLKCASSHGLLKHSPSNTGSLKHATGSLKRIKRKTGSMRSVFSHAGSFKYVPSRAGSIRSMLSQTASFKSRTGSMKTSATSQLSSTRYASSSHGSVPGAPNLTR